MKKYVLYLFYAATLILLIIGLITSNHDTIYFSSAGLILYAIVFAIEKIFKKLNISFILNFFIHFFIFVAAVIGEVFDLYKIIPCYDNILHALFGLITSYALYLLLKKHVQNKGILLLLILTTTVSIGVAWEFFEYGVDHILKNDMQKYTLITELRHHHFDSEVNNIKYTVIYDEKGEHKIEGGYYDTGIMDTMEDMAFNILGSVILVLVLAKKKTNK